MLQGLDRRITADELQRPNRFGSQAEAEAAARAHRGEEYVVQEVDGSYALYAWSSNVRVTPVPQADVSANRVQFPNVRSFMWEEENVRQRVVALRAFQQAHAHDRLAVAASPDGTLTLSAGGESLTLHRSDLPWRTHFDDGRLEREDLFSATMELHEYGARQGLNEEALQHLVGGFQQEAAGLGVAAAYDRAKLLIEFSRLSDEDLQRELATAASNYNVSSLEAAICYILRDSELAGMKDQYRRNDEATRMVQMRYHAALATLWARGVQVEPPALNPLPESSELADRAWQRLCDERLAAAAAVGTWEAMKVRAQNMAESFARGVGKAVYGMYEFGANLVTRPGETLSEMATGLYTAARHPVMTVQALGRAWTEATPEGKIEIMGQISTILATIPAGAGVAQGVRNAAIAADAALASFRAYQAVRTAVLSLRAAGRATAAVEETARRAEAAAQRVSQLTDDVQRVSREAAEAATNGTERVAQLERNLAERTRALQAAQRELDDATRSLGRQVEGAGVEAPEPPVRPPAAAELRQELLNELRRAGIRHTPENIVDIRRAANGRIVFLETGNSRAGLLHILGRHADDFARRGISREQIPDLVMRAATEGNVVGYQNARPIMEVMFNGRTHRVAVTVGDNGFIVGANPA